MKLIPQRLWRLLFFSRLDSIEFVVALHYIVMTLMIMTGENINSIGVAFFGTMSISSLAHMFMIWVEDYMQWRSRNLMFLFLMTMFLASWTYMNRGSEAGEIQWVAHALVAFIMSIAYLALRFGEESVD